MADSVRSIIRVTACSFTTTVREKSKWLASCTVENVESCATKQSHFTARFQKNKSSEAASSQPPQQEPQQQSAAASAASASAPEQASTSSGADVAAATEETAAEKQQSKADVNDRVERWEWLDDYDGGVGGT